MNRTVDRQLNRGQVVEARPCVKEDTVRGRLDQDILLQGGAGCLSPGSPGHAAAADTCSKVPVSAHLASLLSRRAAVRVPVTYGDLTRGGYLGQQESCDAFFAHARLPALVPMPGKLDAVDMEAARTAGQLSGPVMCLEVSVGIGDPAEPDVRGRRPVFFANRQGVCGQ